MTDDEILATLTLYGWEPGASGTAYLLHNRQRMVALVLLARARCQMMDLSGINLMGIDHRPNMPQIRTLYNYLVKEGSL